MKQKFIFLIMLSGLLRCEAQNFNQTPQYINGNSVWVFGKGAGFNFNTHTAFQTPIQSEEGCASVANRNTGVLQFSSDGRSAWNKNQGVMTTRPISVPPTRIIIDRNIKQLDLYSEALPRYYQLIPNKEDRLIILALYQKYEKQEFTEEQIIQVINKVLIDLGSLGQREEHNRNSNIIAEQQNLEYKQSGRDEYLKWVCGFANRKVSRMQNRPLI